MKKSLLICLLWGLTLTMASAAQLGTAFTYSGRLKYQNQPANGNFDLQVKLYDAANGGNQVGQLINVNGLSFVNGLFVTSLDFGGGVFNGTAYWLDIAARPSGNGPFTPLSPRQPVNPAPYALYALTPAGPQGPKGDKGDKGDQGLQGLQGIQGLQGLKGDTGDIGSIGPIGPKGDKGDKGDQGLQGLQGIQGLQGPKGDTGETGPIGPIGPKGDKGDQGDPGPAGPPGSANGWSLTGNAGTTPGVNFLGTTDSQPLELKTKNLRALHLEFAGASFRNSINTLGGVSINTFINNPIGATISGGGLYDGFTGDLPNTVSADFGTVGGGAGNSVGGLYGTIPGGFGNVANGYGSFAAGQNARANHDGSFVWGDGNGTADSTGPRSFAVHASGGMTLNSPRGISLNAADKPIITRGWDPFDNSAGDKAGLGRWGLFMEFTEMVLGMPDTDIGPRTLAFGRYHRDGSYDALMTIRNTDGRATFNADFAVVNGFGGELAYIGGDGVGADVQIGSLNPNVSAVALWNVPNGRYMDLYVRTLTITGGADLAEPFEMSDSDIPKGSVVVIDDEHSGRLKLSTEPYDTRVAGIVSGANGINPGLSLRQEGKLDSGENVALSGRVYVRADCVNGAIKPGDLLTTSSTPGHAMKVTDHTCAQGAILGKAMSGLKEGNGMVLVLVTLQ